MCRAIADTHKVEQFVWHLRTSGIKCIDGCVTEKVLLRVRFDGDKAPHVFRFEQGFQLLIIVALTAPDQITLVRGSLRI